MSQSTSAAPAPSEANATATTLDPLDAARERLRDAGLRITHPRMAIIRALLEAKEPVSIERIHDSLTADSCDLVTVYRSLTAFEIIGLVRRSFSRNSAALFALTLGRQPQYYVVPYAADALLPLDPESCAELAATMQKIEARLQARGYRQLSHVAEFFANPPRP